MRITKKRFVLIALFVFPLLFFLILSTGINNFEKLPLLTSKVNLKEIEGMANVSLRDQVTILCFLGNDVDAKKGGFFNLNQKIYKEFYGYIPFQILAVYPKGSEESILKIKSEIGAFTNMSKWKFIPLDDASITTLYSNLKVKEPLDPTLFSKRAFLLDKELNLRGRDDDEDMEDGFLYGYNIQSVAELSNKMEDDIKVLLYEYRAAFKNKKKADRKNKKDE